MLIKINKTLCELTLTEIKKYSKELKKLTDESKYYCNSCFRSSSERKLLCKPKNNK